MAFDKQQQVSSLEPIYELLGKVGSSFADKKLMHSVLEGDKEKIEDGKLISESINQGIGSFTPELMFENLVKDYSIANKIYGEAIIRRIAGYDPRYVEKNINIPEFRRELKAEIYKNIEDLQKKGIIDEQGQVTEKGIELASITMYVEELDHLVPKGFVGTKTKKTEDVYGDKLELTEYKKQPYRDIATKSSVKLAIRRAHTEIQPRDLRTFKRKSKGQISIVYALDASGSMKGKKIEQCKKAGIALAYKAIDERDNVGLIVFGDKVKEEISPTKDFVKLIKTITSIRANNQTNIAETIHHAIILFPKKRITKHLILITDALPTVGHDPEKSTLEAASLARASNITISLVGIKLDEKGESLAKKIVAIGEGRLYAVRDLEKIDKLVLEDYYKTVG